MKKTKIAGLDVNVVSTEELEEKAKTDTIVVLCNRTDFMKNPVEGSTKEVCHACSNEVWLSPATKESTANIKEAVFECLECMSTRMKK